MDTALDLPIFPDADPSAVEMNMLLARMKRGVNSEAFRCFGNHVLNGPFVGMKIPERNPAWDDGNASVKLLGVYEHELHETIRYAMWRAPKSVINVGCGEGYYAIGLAMKMRSVRVFAFDITSGSLEMCLDYATRNKIADRVVLREGCRSPLELQVPDAEGHRLYLLDCEGAERGLVDPESCPELRHSDIIVECHDFIEGDISVTLADRLSRTHRVDLVSPRLPNLESFQFVKTSPALMSVLAAVEMRPLPSCWLACWATEKGR